MNHAEFRVLPTEYTDYTEEIELGAKSCEL
jgi:hypothetical protein